MEKEIATTYKEYKNGATQVAGFGRLGCYQGLDYIENILKNDKYYSEKLEDGFIFIQSYINCIEQQCKKQKEVIIKAVLELVNIDGNLSNSQLSDRICNLIDILEGEDKEVSE